MSNRHRTRSSAPHHSFRLPPPRPARADFHPATCCWFRPAHAAPGSSPARPWPIRRGSSRASAPRACSGPTTPPRCCRPSPPISACATAPLTPPSPHEHHHRSTASRITPATQPLYRQSRPRNRHAARHGADGCSTHRTPAPGSHGLPAHRCRQSPRLRSAARTHHLLRPRPERHPAAVQRQRPRQHQPAAARAGRPAPRRHQPLGCQPLLSRHRSAGSASRADQSAAPAHRHRREGPQLAGPHRPPRPARRGLPPRQRSGSVHPRGGLDLLPRCPARIRPLRAHASRLLDLTGGHRLRTARLPPGRQQPPPPPRAQRSRPRGLWRSAQPRHRRCYQLSVAPAPVQFNHARSPVAAPAAGLSRLHPLHP